MNGQSGYEKLQDYKQDDVKEAIEIMLGGMQFYYQYFENGWPEPYTNLNDTNQNLERGILGWNYRDDQNRQRNHIDDEIVEWLQFFSVLTIDSENYTSLTSWTRNLITSLKRDIRTDKKDAKRILWLVIREWRDLLVTLLFPSEEQETTISKNRIKNFNMKVRDIEKLMWKLPAWFTEDGQADLKKLIDNEIHIKYKSSKLSHYLSDDQFPVYFPLSYLRDHTHLNWKMIKSHYREDRVLNHKIANTFWLLEKSIKHSMATNVITTILDNFGLREERSADERQDMDVERRYKSFKRKLRNRKAEQ